MRSKSQILSKLRADGHITDEEYKALKQESICPSHGVDCEDCPAYKPQEPKTGKLNLEIEDWNKWTCSNCGWEKRTDIHVRLGYKYCPNCGCRMVEPQESEVLYGNI